LPCQSSLLQFPPPSSSSCTLRGGDLRVTPLYVVVLSCAARNSRFLLGSANGSSATLRSAMYVGGEPHVGSHGEVEDTPFNARSPNLFCLQIRLDNNTVFEQYKHGIHFGYTNLCDSGLLQNPDDATDALRCPWVCVHATQIRLDP
jgi:hypothetical protein